jgi:hypothetical protein
MRCSALPRQRGHIMTHKSCCHVNDRVLCFDAMIPGSICICHSAGGFQTSFENLNEENGEVNA